MNYFAIEVKTGLIIKFVETCPSGRCVVGAAWDDDSHLRLTTSDGGNYLLDAATLAVQQASRDVSNEPSRRPQSATNGWTVATVPADEDRVSLKVARAVGTEEFLITGIVHERGTDAKTSTWEWSPKDDILAVTGNACARDGFDLLTVDANSRRVVNLTRLLEPGVFGLSWRPDGNVIAVGGNFFRQGRLFVALVNVATAHVEPLIEFSWGGELVPLAWSPGGTRLLVGVHGGGGLCDSNIRPDTSVEPISGGP